MERVLRKEKMIFSGFTKAEIEKMEKLLQESGHNLLNREFCQKITQSFNRSSGRAGKPAVNLKEVQDWFRKRLKDNPVKETCPSKVTSPKKCVQNDCAANNAHESSKLPGGGKVPNLSDLEFEARSSKDGAWYDVDTFLTHRFLSSGEAEVRVRFVGFGAEEDEWINIKKSVRVRSLPLEHFECEKVKVGDLVLCFQERRDQAIYYDAHIIEIQRRMHDIRGCRCLFLIRYDHDNTEERVHLRRLCCRPTF